MRRDARRATPPLRASCAQRGDAAFRGDDQVAWLREVHREADNLRAALGWVIDRGDAETALRR